MKRNLLSALMIMLFVIPAFAGNDALTQAQGDRLWIAPANAEAGEQITVDLMIENGVTDVDAVTMTLKYDANELQFVDWADGSLDPGWVMFNVNEKTDGVIHVAGFCVKTAVKAGSKGSLVRLNFKVKGKAGSSSYISFDKLRDDIQGFNYENGKIMVKGAAALTK